MLTLKRSQIRLVLAALAISCLLVLPVAGPAYTGDCPNTSSGSCAG